MWNAEAMGLGRFGGSVAPRTLIMAAPLIDGPSATMLTEIDCGPLCALGGMMALRREPDGTWKATGPIGGQMIS